MEQVFRRHQDALATVIEGRTVLLNVGNGRCYESNPLGSYIWALLEHPHSLPEIAEKIASRYPADAERSRADTASFLLELHSAGLVTHPQEVSEPGLDT